MRNLVGGVMTPPYGALNNILQKHGCCLHRLMQAAGEDTHEMGYSLTLRW